ncbi:MAG: VWA domain-containing protein [Nitrosomonas sp.]|nr:VWA domain-containing protein [Nitrosomonas sp.]
MLLTAGMPRTTHHRLNWKQKLGYDHEKLPLATLTAERILLPDSICLYPQQSLNRQLYFWLAAFFTPGEHTRSFPTDIDPLQADLLFLHRAYWTSIHITERYPGLKRSYDMLCAQLLQSRPRRKLPTQEQMVESVILGLLGGTCNHAGAAAWFTRMCERTVDFSDCHAARGYHTFLPVPLWGEVASSPRHKLDSTQCTAEDRSNQPESNTADKRVKKAQRNKFEQSERDDPLLLNRFEKLITWSEMVNLNRPVEDDEETTARNVAESMEELAITTHQRPAATLLKFDLDLAPGDVDPTAIFAQLTYPEWDYRHKRYHAHHCQVLCQVASAHGEHWAPDDKTKQQIRRIRRQFEAFRPQKTILHRQLDGVELDLDAVVRDQSDRAANGSGSDRLYLSAREQARDLAVLILVDVSLSTDSWINNQRILDTEKSALIALATSIATCGDRFSIYTFTSRKRHYVKFSTIKAFSSPFNQQTLSRISALRPGYYTRMGAALRHASNILASCPERHRLLLLLSDGKPNDLDHYEGRYGIEDTRQAILEARRNGLRLFGITIDDEAKHYFPYLFGRGGHAIVSQPERLVEIAPALYRQLIS